jgi:hypothetical protein
MYVKYLIFILSIFILISCEIPEQQEYKADELVKIISPRDNWNYYESRTIQLSLNIKENNILWYSDIDGFLGSGNGLFVNLHRGFHNIEAHYNGKVFSITIEIKQDIINYLEERRYLLNSQEDHININKGLWYPSVISHEGTMISFNYGNPEPQKFSAQINVNVNSQMRDFHINVENMYNLKINAKKSRAVKMRTYSVGNKKEFKVINTKEPLDEPHKINAEMIYSGDRYTIWRDEKEPINSIALKQCTDNLDKIIMPRLLNIWGEWADIDEDGKVAILFSKTINNEKLAVGFFNPKDLFITEDDPDEPSFNSDSNEMDIIYAAYPYIGDPIYNPSAISATFAHEITHLITFSQKTYNKLLQGNINANRETVYLEEGWSHLSENLCGFGISGGNIMFLKKYFEDTSKYSLCTPNAMGDIDSVGLRGAIGLFFSWLFWRQGGMEWHDSIPGIVYDRGGISFLKKLVNLNSVGWPSIGQAAGMTMDELFLEFVRDMNRQRAMNKLYTYKVDPYTKEPVEFYNNMGVLTYQGTPYNIAVSNTVTAGAYYNTLPWSFFFLEPMITEDNYTMQISSSLVIGKIYFSLVKGN